MADNLLRFWYRFIFDQRDVIQNGFGEILFREDLEGIRDFTARSFADVALLWLEEQNRQGNCPYTMARSAIIRLKTQGLAALSSWTVWRRGSVGIATSACCRMQVSGKTPFSMAMLVHLRESLSLFDQYKVIDYYLVSRSGFTEDVCAIHDQHRHLITFG